MRNKGGQIPPEEGRGVANDNDWVRRMLEAGAVPVPAWAPPEAAAPELAPGQDTLPPHLLPSAIAQLEVRLEQMAEVLEEIGTPNAQAASQQLPEVDVPVLRGMPVAQGLSYRPMPQDTLLERRRARRRRALGGASFVADGHREACVLVDLSRLGVRLHLLTSAVAPDAVVLHLPGGITRAARKRWQRQAEAGFAFVVPLSETEEK